MSTYTKNNILLDAPVTTVPMIGDKTADKLAALGIENVRDLLYHFPKRYIDTRQISKIRKAAEDENLYTVKGTITKTRSFYSRNRKFIVIARVADKSGEIEAVWFNQRFLAKLIKEDSKILLSGRVKEYNGKLTFFSPEYELDFNDGKRRHLGRISPVYPLTAGLTQKWLRSRIEYIVDGLNAKQITETLPKKVIKDENLISLLKALKWIHSPKTNMQIDQAVERLKFEELFWLMHKVQKRKIEWNKTQSKKIKIDSTLQKNLEQKVPFDLTKSQKLSIKEILEDITRKSPMDRLLSGDVGSGKTIVAVAAAIQAINSGYKAILLAPTTILANQHYKTITKLLKDFDVKIALLTGDPTKQDLNTAHHADFLIGTQAILHHQELISNLGLIIIDEQHRFGVKQRDSLIKLMKNLPLPYSPHRLTLTATPIPRTMALVFFGDQDLSLLDTLPKGRKKIKTAYVPENKKEEIYKWIKRKLASKNTRVFVVCPLIEESESLQTKAVKTEFEEIKIRFPKYTTSLLHGRLKQNEKDKILNAFRKGESKILVSTPVIEVGIDIPEANILLIEGAERFGLAQLHQLRGRIGRGNQQAYCFVALEKKTENAIDRIAYFCKTDNGLKLADYDLKLRGPGEVYGTKQAGFPDLKISSLTDVKMLKRARKAAEKWLKR